MGRMGERLMEMKKIKEMNHTSGRYIHITSGSADKFREEFNSTAK